MTPSSVSYCMRLTLMEALNVAQYSLTDQTAWRICCPLFPKSGPARIFRELEYLVERQMATVDYTDPSNGWTARITPLGVKFVNDYSAAIRRGKGIPAPLKEVLAGPPLPPKTLHDLLTYLARHVGRDQAVHFTAIARALHISGRRVIQLVSELHEYGVAVCGDRANGYYIAADAEDLERICCALQRARAMRSLALESSLRRIPLRDLLNQIHLTT